MLLLATNKRDITTDFIVLELRRRGLLFVRLNTEDIAGAAVRFDPRDGWVYDVEDRRFDLTEVSAAYYRRPGPPAPPAELADAAARGYCVEEWSAVLRSLWNALDGKWLNSPFAILRAEDKPQQLARAADLGFAVPETLVSNDFAAVSAFVETHRAVAKPLRNALIERGDAGEVLFTSRVGPLGEADRAAVALAPVIYQGEIDKRVDLRVTVVGTRVFAAAIHSQACDETEVDWRKGSRPDLTHEAIALPDDIARRCVALTQDLGLRFGAIDLVLDKAGRYWFLEINPNGQWAWIERRTGMPIAAAIVDCLEDIGA